MKRLLLSILVISSILLGACAASSTTPPTETPPNPEWHSGRVWTSESAYVVDGYNNPIILIDNRSAVNPTYAQLLAFLKEDKTESYPYAGGIHGYYIPALIPGGLDVFEEREAARKQAETEGIEFDWPSICSEYAEMLHNNAERVGIRAGYVICTDHAMNVFETVDRGLVFIDCTGFVWSFDGIDKIANIDSDGKVALTPLWPDDSIDYCDIFFGEDVYFEEIVWEGK